MLTPAQTRQARLNARAGVTHGEIGRRLGVSRPPIVAVLGSHGPLYPQDELPAAADAAAPSRARLAATAARPRTARQNTPGTPAQDQCPGEDQAPADQVPQGAFIFWTAGLSPGAFLSGAWWGTFGP